MEQVVGLALDGRVPAELLRRLERLLRVGGVARPEQGEPAVELDDRARLPLGRRPAARVLEPEPLHLVDAPVRPALERGDNRGRGGPRKTDRDRRLPGHGLRLMRGRPRVEREPDHDAGRHETGDSDGDVQGEAGGHVLAPRYRLAGNAAWSYYRLYSNGDVQRTSQAGQGQDRRGRPPGGRRARRRGLDRRPRAGRVGRGAHPRRRARPARQPRVPHRGASSPTARRLS